MGKLFILILVAILQDIAATDWCAKYYEHSDYNGWEKVAGETSQLNLINENDQISSVKVQPGCTLKLFEHINKEGLLVTLTTDVSALSHNDKVSSLSCTCLPDESLKNLFGCTANEICKMSMKSEQGKYVTAMGYHDKYEANANSPTIGSDQIWEVIFKGDGKVSLKGAHGRYLRWYGNGQVKADAEKPNPWETFIVEDMGNGKLAFFQKNYNKKYYLVAGSDGALTNQDAAEAGIKFEIVPAANIPCPAKNQDMLGNDIHIQVVGSWDECGSLCYNHSSCKYWTWIEDYNGLPQYCFLKDANSGLSYLEGVISGEKKCMAPKAN